MEYVLHVCLSFIATACFGVIFNAPTKAIPYCGLVGMVGWTLYFILSGYGMQAIHASFICAFIVAIVAHTFARKFRLPMIIFSVSGIIPLVPGGTAYNSMRSIVEFDYTMGLEFGMRAFMISGALAMGLVFAEVIMQIMSRLMRKGKTSIQSFAKVKNKL